MDATTRRPSESKVIFTVAPELKNALDLAKEMIRQGVVLSAGHTDADYDMAMRAFGAGFTHVTHFFNAMAPFHHRKLGIVGAALSSRRISLDAILDGHHIHPLAASLLLKAKGPERVSLISDSTRYTGMSSRRIRQETKRITLAGGTPKLRNGTIAGSACLQNKGLEVGVRDAGLPILDTLRMLTQAPAKVLQRNDIGALSRRSLADITFLDPAGLQVVGSLIGGRHLFFSERRFRQFETDIC
jgi:N-acetylglucosamine-6-phosphate deacetylase